jgi:HAD superfamily hydrolase (TIGR01509 family)
MMTIRAVIFDRDGVLTYFDLAAAAAYLCPLLPLQLDQVHARWERWGAQVGFPRSVVEEQRFWRSFWDQICDEESLGDEARAALQRFRYTSVIHAYPEARAALLAARRAGLRTGVLSNFTLASLDDSLEAAGLADLVDVACAAPVIASAKPQRAAYLAVTGALEVSPEECLFFDDEAPCVAGARALGMHALLVSRDAVQHQLDLGVVRDLSVLDQLDELVARAGAQAA